MPFDNHIWELYCSAAGPMLDGKHGHVEHDRMTVAQFDEAWERVPLPADGVGAAVSDAHGGRIVGVRGPDDVDSLLLCKICRAGYQMKMKIC